MFNFFNALLGSKYLIITVISVIIATIFSDKLAKVGGAQELGTYFIYLFFATMSAPVSIRLLVGDAPWFFVACMIIVVINILFVLLGSKLLHFGIEAVSYTHLGDGEPEPDAGREGPDGPGDGHFKEEDVRSPASVSYTHLDVYKRQEERHREGGPV